MPSICGLYRYRCQNLRQPTAQPILKSHKTVQTCQKIGPKNGQRLRTGIREIRVIREIRDSEINTDRPEQFQTNLPLDKLPLRLYDE
jgi:hypothetical protein